MCHMRMHTAAHACSADSGLRHAELVSLEKDSFVIVYAGFLPVDRGSPGAIRPLQEAVAGGQRQEVPIMTVREFED